MVPGSPRRSHAMLGCRWAEMTINGDREHFPKTHPRQYPHGDACRGEPSIYEQQIAAQVTGMPERHPKARVRGRAPGDRSNGAAGSASPSS